MARLTNGPTFVLCVGAQKAGTTWLHRYVSSADGAVKPFMKEYHVWNHVYGAADEPLVPFHGNASAERVRLQERFIEDPELYFDWFGEQLGGDGGHIASDMTPAYAGLPAAAYRRIREGFERRGIRTRVVFLLRDPVERCWSAARMYLDQGLDLPGLPEPSDSAQALAAYSRTPHAQRRGRYERTIEALEEAFTPDQLFFGIHESLFQLENVRLLSAFLGTDARTEFASERHNFSSRRLGLAGETQRQVADAFRPTLDYCADRFPETLKLWPSFAAGEKSATD